jgi:hypothetical protein
MTNATIVIITMRATIILLILWNNKNSGADPGGPVRVVKLVGY